ncbi:WGR domain-containing protein [Thalassovita mangrovi]|uniref:WGR domain-containing protein n=1 Tax=Thalassovita mangrovi TaxID=2692236 RepID=A0A6L8LI27_9RHOB|nr:WGR domain-containing protein [Thalassovita mangrovi]MYM55668.1 WGR domain-containing protein [Thalassovita mangrovi]
MTSCLLYRPTPQSFRPRYYRVEIAMNLLEEVSVMREWGISGGKGQSRIDLFGNLRQASEQADRLRNAALKRGYHRTDAA